MDHSTPFRTVAAGMTIAAFMLLIRPCRAAEKPVMFEDMDYGPAFAYTIQAEWPKDNGNLAVKGLAIKLDGGKAGVLFDMDLMRVAAAWVNDSGKPYLDLSRTNMTSYKGDALAYPRGKRVFGTQVTPGWAFEGSFKDTREGPHGRLPDMHAKFKGYAIDGDRVALNYTVGDGEVTESFRMVDVAGQKLFMRGFRLREPTPALKLLACEEPGGTPFDLSKADARLAARAAKHQAAAIAVDDDVLVILGLNPAVEVDKNVARVSLEWGAFPNLTRRTYHFAMVTLWRGPATDLPKLGDALDAAERDGLFYLNDYFFHRRPEKHKPLWPTIVTTQGTRASNDATGGPYVLDHITCPEDNPYKAWIRPTGFDFFPDGKRAAISTWNGDIWIVDGIDDTLQALRWKRFATGLHEPLGVVVMNGDIFTTGRDQITRLRDLSNDGEADYYETFNNDGIAWPRTMAMELHRDAAGNLYYIKNGNRVPGNIPLQGCIFKVLPDGKKQEVYATGFRSANGLSVSPDGLVTIADQEGNWVPTTRLDLVKPAPPIKFYGYRPHSHGMVPETPTTDPPNDYELPMCWIPKPVDNSAGGQAWITSDNWGPFKGRLVHTSYGKARLFLTMYETIDGVTQGGIVQFPLAFESGIMRARVNPRDGQLYVLGMRGWQTDGTCDSGFFRVRYTGKAVNMPTMLNVKHDGVLITFTDPVDKASAGDTGNFAVERWNYVYAAKYGSDEFSVENPRRKGHDPVDIEAAEVSADGRSVLLKIPDITPVMQQSIRFNIKAADGSPVNYTIYHTIHKVP